MSEWIDITLEEVATIQIGGTPTRAISSYWSNEYGSGFPWVSIADLKHSVVTETKERITERGIKNSNTKLINKGTLIMSFKLSIGRVAMTGIDLFTNEAIAAIIPKDNRIDSNLLYYILPVATQKAVTDTAVKGATLNKSSLGKLCLRVPSEPRQQEKIAEILQTVDRAIAHTEALIEKYQQIKAGLMHDLFTRGIGADGKLRPTREEAPELYQESAIGWIPREWEIKYCSDLCTRICVGIVIKPAQYYVEDGIPAFRSANIREDGIDPDNLVYISPESNKLLAKSQVKEGDILSVRTGYPGTSAVVPEEFSGVNCVDILISTPGHRISSQYLCYWVNSSFGKEQVLRQQGGMAQQHFNVAEMRQLLVGLPSVREQNLVVDKLAVCDRKIEAEKETLAKLNKQKSGLMHDLLTGKVPVKVNPDEVDRI